MVSDDVRFGTLAYVACLALMISEPMWSQTSTDAEVGGKPLAEWLALLSDSSPAERARAAQAVYLLGESASAAVPKLAKLLNDPSEDVRYQALLALAGMGKSANNAIPALVARLGTDDALTAPGLDSGESPLLKVLAERGLDAVPALTIALRDRDASVRSGAATALGLVGSAAEAAVPALVSCVSDEDDLVQREAIEALGHIGEAARPAIPAMVTLFEKEGVLTADGLDPNPVTQELAVALGTLGAEPPDSLKNDLLAADAMRVGAALDRLESFGLRAKPYAVVVEQLLSHVNSGVRHSAAMTLARIDPTANGAMEHLMAALVDRDSSRRSDAAYTLAALGPRARSAIPALTTALRDENTEVREEAALAISRIDPTVPMAADVLVDLVRAKKENPQQIGRLVLALASRGEHARKAIGPLGEALRHAHAPTNLDILEALVEIDPSGKEIAPILAETARRPGFEIRQAAIQVLGNRRSQLDFSIPILLQVLSDPDPTIRIASANALRRIGVADMAVVPALTARLQDENHHVVSAAAEALGEIGPPAVSAIPALKRGLDKADIHDQWALTIALARLDPASRDRVARLAHESRDFRFRAEVFGALGQETPEGQGFTRYALEGLDAALRRATDKDASEPILRQQDMDGAISILNALSNLGAGARSAAPKLQSLVGHADPNIRDAVQQALNRIGAANLR